MFNSQPVFSKQPALVKLLVLILLILLCTFMSFFISVLLAVPFFGKQMLDVFTGGIDLMDSGNIGLMKFLQMASQVGIFIFPSLIFSWLAFGNIEKSLALHKFPSVQTLILTTILIYSMLPGIQLLIQFNENLQLPDFMKGIEAWMIAKEAEAARLTEAFLDTASFGGLAVNFFMIGILAAIGEELLFRAVLIRLLVDWTKNKHLAVIISSVVFSAFHLQFYGFVPRFVLGLLFGYLFLWSGTVWLPIAAHLLNNGSAVIISFLAKRGFLSVDAEKFGTVDNLPLLLASIVLTIAVLIGIYFSENQQKFRKLYHF